MTGPWWFLSVLFAVVAGYSAARLREPKVWESIRSFINRSSSSASWANRRTYNALTNLFNDRPDEALDSFVANLEVNSETLEMHLALGGLLRRKGEVDRAVRVHQNLTASMELDTTERNEVSLELARDYLASGLYDRAEDILKPLASDLTCSLHVRDAASQHLIELYQELGEWLLAIDLADQLTSAKFSDEADHWRTLQAQFSCELAENAVKQNNPDLAGQKIRTALAYDANCYRAKLLQVEVLLLDHARASAAAVLSSLAKTDSAFIVETMALFEQCFDGGDTSQLLDTLKGVQEQCPSLYLLVRITELLSKSEGGALAIRYWQEQLERFPALTKEARLFRFAIQGQADSNCDEMLQVVKEIVLSKLVKRCVSCGFETTKTRWRCPSCMSWASIQLVQR